MKPVMLFIGAVVMIGLSFIGPEMNPEAAVGVGLMWLSAASLK